MIDSTRQVRRQSALKAQGGSILIEGLVSIFIFSLGVIALIGMQTMSINESIHGKYRMDAGYLANEIVGQMMLDKNNIANYPDAATTTSPFRTAWNTRVAAILPNGSATIAANGSAVSIVVSWRNPNETSSHSYRSVAQVIF